MSNDPTQIPLEDLGDRELLLFTAQKVNGLADNFRDHEQRLRWIEKEAWAIRGLFVVVISWLKGRWGN